ncbi:hypothetical protein IFM89_013865 [Coptis chinensis]|uniref:Strictosidine synthase conserved region domain-containing protein n=1 Tax=Coptis chinensis TaxID=261450 RepID=A0A835IW41_9MAGN|nr:hypothetical protein IFM89_013865 [Coptis chinensis]
MHYKKSSSLYVFPFQINSYGFQADCPHLFHNANFPSWHIFLLPSFFPSFTLYTQVGENDNKVKSYQRLQLKSGVGPESFAFDCNGEGPYTGISDGRILKWQGQSHGWTEFAVTSQNRRREICDGSNNPTLEHVCGRPLGLQFNKKTCELYIADAYFGLLKVGPRGGVATPLATSAEGVRFWFTNAVDIDQENGLVYFTDSSIWFQRWAYLLLLLSGDNTGRLMKYNPQNGEVTVLLRGLKMANGVALSKDNTYILVAETTRSRILRYWLQGPKARTSDVFSQLSGHPDNIKRNSKGEYWVALNNGRGRLAKSIDSNPQTTAQSDTISTTMTFSMDDTVAARLDDKGKVVEALRSNNGRNLESVSEVDENNGTLWIGSVVMPYVSLSTI